jgi:hypothetical protein
VTFSGAGVPGSGGVVPRIIAEGPPMLGSQDFRVGLDGALGGAAAALNMSFSPPVDGRITPDRVLGTATAAGMGAGTGLATVHWPLHPGEVAAGQVYYLQWMVSDPAAAGGTALSAVARVPVFCGSSGCPAPCGYANCDQSTTAPALNVNDFVCFQARFASGDPYANCDQSTTPPVLSVNDFVCFLGEFAAGCR